MENIENVNIPKHIGIIMDGNRKWAKANNKNIAEGYLRGQQVFDEVCLNCIEIGIPYLTTFAFSLENLKRSDFEIRSLLDLLFGKLRDEQWFAENNIRVYFAGAINLFSEQEQKILHDLSTVTSKCNGLNVTIALNYDGYDEIINALNQIIKKKDIIKKVSEETIDKYLYTSHLPPLDLIIRTANIQRLTRFLLWKSPYAECIFLKKYWPDFTKDDFIEAINEYGKRERRYGI